MRQCGSTRVHQCSNPQDLFFISPVLRFLLLGLISPFSITHFPLFLHIPSEKCYRCSAKMRSSEISHRLKKIAAAGLFLPLAAVVFLAAWFGLAASSLPSVDFIRDPSASFQIKVLDWDGGRHDLTVGPANSHWTPLSETPESLRQAIIVAEDFNFYHHRGVDWFEVFESVKRNFREHQFARGASTISQQVAKNIFLSRDKTLSRKGRELILTRRLEKSLSKDRILELYLNVVELGPLVYSVGHASDYYFEKSPGELTLRESTFLAAMLPGPRFYNPYRRMDRVLERSDRILGILARAGKITDAEYMAALDELPVPRGLGEWEETVESGIWTVESSPFPVPGT